MSPTIDPKPYQTVIAVIAVISLFVTILVSAISAENRFVHQEQYRYDLAQVRADHNADMAELRDVLKDIRADLRELNRKMEASNGQSQP